jgi:hypothetical protein
VSSEIQARNPSLGCFVFSELHTVCRSYSPQTTSRDPWFDAVGANCGGLTSSKERKTRCGSGPLEAKDIALSRRKPGFESWWGHYRKSTFSADYPTTPGAFDTTFNGNSDAFVTKLPIG